MPGRWSWPVREYADGGGVRGGEDWLSDFSCDLWALSEVSWHSPGECAATFKLWPDIPQLRVHRGAVCVFVGTSCAI
jgi:hypothetical protein